MPPSTRSLHTLPACGSLYVEPSVDGRRSFRCTPHIIYYVATVALSCHSGCTSIATSIQVMARDAVSCALCERSSERGVLQAPHPTAACLCVRHSVICPPITPSSRNVPSSATGGSAMTSSSSVGVAPRGAVEAACSACVAVTVSAVPMAWPQPAQRRGQGGSSTAPTLSTLTAL